MIASPHRLLPFAFLVLLVASPAAGQPSYAPLPFAPGPAVVSLRYSLPSGSAGHGSQSLDERLFYDIYGIQGAGIEGYLRTIDDAAYPVFAGVPAAAWAGAWLLDADHDWEPAYRLTLTEVVATAATFGLKYLIQRERPYVALPDVELRAGNEPDPYSFPSGHVALAFAVASSLSLSYPEWYVIAPAAVWATSVAVSRIWLGVHYPSDVLAGALLGTAVGLTVHLLGPHVTPSFLRSGRP
jgi:membrane-associated phospholipid phosphatase